MHNAMSRTFFDEIRTTFKTASLDPDTRCVVLSAEGPNFTSGLDLEDYQHLFSSDAPVDEEEEGEADGEGEGDGEGEALEEEE